MINTLEKVETVEVKSHEITLLPRQWRIGGRDAEAQLFDLPMPELHRIWARYFGTGRTGHTLQTTALVNEGFLRLAASKNVGFQDRGHFLATAALVMRRCLIDHARPRPNAYFLPLEGIPEGLLASHNPLELAVAVDTLIDEPGAKSPPRRSVVELKFFLGMTMKKPPKRWASRCIRCSANGTRLAAGCLND